MKAALVIMAAGLGSRYGGNKQVDGVGPQGEMLMEYSIYDAVRAGFTKVVFIIKPDMRELMDRLWGDRTLITKTGEPLEPNPFDCRYFAADNNMGENIENKVQTDQPVIPHDSYLASYVTALDLCLQGIISPSTLGIDTKKLDNAEAQREKEKTTLYTRNAIVEALQETLPNVVSAAVNAYNILIGQQVEAVKVDIPFGEYANPSFESQVETVSKAKQGGIMSIEASVDELYGDTKDDDWKQEEIARLKAEQGISDMEEPALNMQADGFAVDGVDNSFTGFDNK